MRTYNPVTALGAAFALLCLMTGCATPSKPDAMVPERIAPTHQSSGDVSVAVSGGKDTSSMGASQISNDAFAQALTQAIEQSGVFAKVATSGTRYHLTAFIGKVDQPMFGASMTVKMEVSYTLTETQSRATLWSKNIATEHTAKVSEAFVGATRLRLANEGAAKDSITEALTQIAALNLE